MIYKILADSVVFVHFLWILFLFFGAFFGKRDRVLRIFHISGLCFAILIQIFGWYCPLTYLEVWLRSKQASNATYTGSFIVYYVEKIVYIELSRPLIFAFSIVLFGLNIWVYLTKKSSTFVKK